MASGSKSYTETAQSSYKSTWTYTFTANNITVTGSTFNIPNGTVTAKYVYSGKKYAGAEVEYSPKVNGSLLGTRFYKANKSGGEEQVSWASGATKTLGNMTADDNPTSVTVNTSTYFNSTTSTKKTLPLQFYVRWVYAESSKANGESMYNNIDPNVSHVGDVFSTPATITLNAPPTTSYTQVKSNTSGGFYKDVTTATVTLSSLSAKYGGTISEAKLTIGSQTATRTTNGDLSIKLNATGTFTPKIDLKDSRGQTTSYSLNAITVTALAATTFDYTQLTSSTLPYYYTSKTTVTSTISNVVVPNNGTFTAKLIVGSQSSAVRTSAGDLTISPLSTAGTFTPKIEVTDSFGRTYSQNLNSVVVKLYVIPSVILKVDRTLPNADKPTPAGKPDDEGESAVLTATFTFSDEISKLNQPGVSVVDKDGVTTTPTVTWYSTRNQDGTLSGSVDWNSLKTNATVYGFISLAFEQDESYQIILTPSDTYETGKPVTQILSTAFYTVDFLAGGHGIAFGLPATKQDVFECGLDAEFNEDVYFALDTTEPPDTTTTDGQIYQALKDLGWDSDVIV